MVLITVPIINFHSLFRLRYPRQGLERNVCGLVCASRSQKEGICIRGHWKIRTNGAESDRRPEKVSIFFHINYVFPSPQVDCTRCEQKYRTLYKSQRGNSRNDALHRLAEILIPNTMKNRNTIRMRSITEDHRLEAKPKGGESRYTEERLAIICTVGPFSTMLLD